MTAITMVSLIGRRLLDPLNSASSFKPWILMGMGGSLCQNWVSSGRRGPRDLQLRRDLPVQWVRREPRDLQIPSDLPRRSVSNIPTVPDRLLPRHGEQRGFG